MRRERRIPFVLFAVCLVAAMPLSWGASGVTNPNLVKPARLIGGVSTDVSTKVTLCHVPPGNPANAHKIVVGQSAVPAHLAHGDYLGECHSACDGVPSPVPKTGQTECLDDDSGALISCAGTGRDGEYQKGVAVDPRFTDNGDGTVKDNLTGLIWLKNASCFGVQLWAHALTLPNALASGACGLTDGSVAGDWRLPNVKELESLIDFGQIFPALPVDHPFSGVTYFYWSSTSSANYTSAAWFVDLIEGFVDRIDKTDGQLYVWPVRGGQ